MITPDMVCPKPHDFTPGDAAHDPPKCERFGDKIMRLLNKLERDRTQNRYPLLPIALPVRESKDNIPNGSRPVRVQTVNAKLLAKICGVKLYRRDFRENESVALRGFSARSSRSRQSRGRGRKASFCGRGPLERQARSPSARCARRAGSKMPPCRG